MSTVVAEREAEALAKFARDLAVAIGRDTVPYAAAQRAAVDPFYLNALLAGRAAPDAIDALLAQPVRNGLPKWAPPPTSVLLGRAGKAMLRWAASGFRPVSEATAQRRLAACRSCLHLSDHGKDWRYGLVGAGQGAVCGMCACAVDKKVRLPTEQCPAPSSDDTALSRWGEPRD